jgi:hypothetical protein
MRANISLIIKGAPIRISLITLDEFDQFEKAKSAKNATSKKVSEKAFKNGIKKATRRKRGVYRLGWQTKRPFHY